MPIKARKGNRLSVDADGYVTAELADITETSYEEGDSERDQLLWEFIAEGTVKPINLKIWTGVIISSEMNWYPLPKSRAEYNKLTQIILSLGVLKESELESFNEDELAEKLESLKGRKVRFKTVQGKSPGLNTIDLKTLRLA